MQFRVALVAGLAAALLAAPTRAQTPETSRTADEALHERFFQSQGSHFIVLFEGPQDQALADRALEILEDAYFRIGTALYTFPAEPLTVVLYTEQQFRDITKAPAWAAAAYDGRIRLPIRGALSRPEELTRVLSHELTHAMIQAIAPARIPPWLHEGLSVAFEPNGIERAQAILASTPKRVPFSRFSKSLTGLSAQEARLAYAESAVVAQRLLDEAGGPKLVTILQDLSKGVSFQQSFEDRLFLSFDRFVASLEALP
jgi:hypothetical protein